MDTGGRSPERLAGLIPALPRDAWLLILGILVGWAGAGFIFSFLTIYLHYVRGISLALAGVTLSFVFVGGLVVSPVAGALTDRVGARRVMTGTLLLGAAGAASLAAVRSPEQAIAAALVYGVAVAGLTGPESALLAVLSPGSARSAAFAVQYAATALGMSAGALLGGLFVDIARPVTFQIGFLAAALPCLAYALLLRRVTVPRTPGDAGEATTDAGAAGGYSRVLGDRVFLRLLAFMLFVITFSGGQFEVAFPAYAVGVGGVSTRVIGYAFGANSLTIVAGSLVMLRVLSGRRRTRVIYLACGFASLCWLMVLVAAHAASTSLAAGGFVAAMVVFALAEMMWSPTYLPMVNDIAPDELRGRYNALSGTVDQFGRIAAPLFAGYLLQVGWGDQLMVLLAAGTAVSTLFISGIARRLPRGADLIGKERDALKGDGAQTQADVLTGPAEAL